MDSNEFDEYAAPLAKKLVDKFQYLIYKTKPLAKILITITQTVIISLINAAIFLLQTIKYFILNIIPTTDSTPLEGKTQTPLQKNLTTTQTLLQSSPLATTTQTLLQNSLDTTKSLVPNTILQKAPDLASQAQDTTKSLVGGIPLVDNVAQSLASNPINVANQIVNTPKSLVPNTVFKTGPDLVNQSQDTTKSLFGGIPLVGNVAESLVTNPTDLTNQLVSSTNSIVNKNPILEVVNSAAQSSLASAESLVPNTILQKGPDLMNQAQDMSKSLIGGIPVVGNVAESLATNPTDLANQILNTTNSLVNQNPLLEAVNSATQNLGMKPQSTGTKVALQSAYTSLKLVAIPVIAQLMYEIINEYPLVGKLLKFIIPVVEFVCKMYNKVVTYMNGKGYNISGYLPLVPIDEMKAAYKLVKTSRDGLSAVGDILGMNNENNIINKGIGDILGMNKNK